MKSSASACRLDRTGDLTQRRVAKRQAVKRRAARGTIAFGIVLSLSSPAIKAGAAEAASATGVNARLEPADPALRKEERQALEVFYAAQGGPDWIDTGNPQTLPQRSALRKVRLATCLVERSVHRWQRVNDDAGGLDIHL